MYVRRTRFSRREDLLLLMPLDLVLKERSKDVSADANGAVSDPDEGADPGEGEEPDADGMYP